LARSAYGTNRRIGEAGVSIARLESLTLLNATPQTLDTPSKPESEYRSAKRPPNIPELPVQASAETAAKTIVEMGAHVTIIDKNLDQLRELDNIFLSKIATLASSAYMVHDAIEGGVNTYAGKLTYQVVAFSQGRDYTALDQLVSLG
jgi:hypothetical protein